MRTWWTSLFLFGCIGLGSQAAFAHTFDDMCAPLTDHTPGFDSPNVLLVVDRSGSMATEMSPGMTRWMTAKTVIEEITVDLERPGPCNDPLDATCDPIRWGLGFFSSTGSLRVEPGEDSASSINADIAATRPSGQTQTHTGVDVLKRSRRLLTDDRPQVAVLVTDGAPDSAVTARQAVRDICSLRDRSQAPVTTYVVGFGPGSNQRVNGFMAAAGGTGMCCYQAGYPCGPDEQVDPCQMTGAELNAAVLDTGADDSTYIHSNYNCGGSLEATDGEAFKRALLNITEEVACTFELDVPPSYPDQAASSDPDATWVEMGHVLFGDVRLPYCAPGDTDCGLSATLQARGVAAGQASEYSDQGWYFPDTTRRRVRVTDGLCGEIQNRRIERISTQVACLCKLTGSPCTLTMEGFTNEQLQRMRCSAGVYECIDGEDVCVGQYGPMPEICNGIDDDCDGGADNMSESWEDPRFRSAAYTIPPSLSGIDCRRIDVCMCPDGRDSVAGDDPQSFFQSWSGACTCGEGLEEPLYTPAPEPMGDMREEPDVACSSTGASGTASLLIVLLAVILRRRRSPLAP